jgi:hypothetical protein
MKNHLLKVQSEKDELKKENDNEKNETQKIPSFKSIAKRQFEKRK